MIAADFSSVKSAHAAVMDHESNCSWPRNKKHKKCAQSHDKCKHTNFNQSTLSCSGPIARHLRNSMALRKLQAAVCSLDLDFQNCSRLRKHPQFWEFYYLSDGSSNRMHYACFISHIGNQYAGIEVQYEIELSIWITNQKKINLKYMI